MLHSVFRFLPVALIVIGIALSANPARAQVDDPADTIRQQIEAFQRGDVTGAFGYASPMIQFRFGSPQNFGLMVQHGYPMVIDPDRVTMRDLFEEGGKTFQQVEFLDQQGKSHLLDYEMIRTEEGWKINGVRFARKPLIAT